MFFYIIIFTRSKGESAEITTGEYTLSLKYLKIQFQEEDERKENVSKGKARLT